MLNIDPLVLYFQLIHDGDIPGWACQHDTDANTSQRLRTIQQRR